jgi:Alpha/beta hydrolase family
MRRRWIGVILRVLAAVLVIALGGLLLWLRPFAATEPALAAMRSGDGIVVEVSPNRLAFRPPNPATVGVIFYPGARVDPRAYAAYMRAVAAAGYAAFIVKPPYNIGFLAANGAADVIADHPEIGAWVVGGHSLGGVVASQFAASHADTVGGLLLYASYPASEVTAPLAGTAVTSISGSNDGLSTPAKIDAAKSRLPATTRYVVIEGGTHAYFGDYGEQPGDGQPAIDREAARTQIVAASLDLLRLVDAQTSTPPSRRDTAGFCWVVR